MRAKFGKRCVSPGVRTMTRWQPGSLRRGDMAASRAWVRWVQRPSRTARRRTSRLVRRTQIGDTGGDFGGCRLDGTRGRTFLVPSVTSGYSATAYGALQQHVGDVMATTRARLVTIGWGPSKPEPGQSLITWSGSRAGSGSARSPSQLRHRRIPPDGHDAGSNTT
jgi:hypothetical protein